MRALHRHSVVGPAVRTTLTGGLFAAATLSAQAWLSPHGRHSAAALALAALALGLPLALLLACGVALVVLLRPKQTVREALLVVSSSDMVLALWTSRPGLAVLSALALSIVVAARNLWSDLSDIRASRACRQILTGAAVALGVIPVLDHPGGFLLTIVALVLLAVLTTSASGVFLLARNAPLPAVKSCATRSAAAHRQESPIPHRSMGMLRAPAATADGRLAATAQVIDRVGGSWACGREIEGY